MKRSHAMPFGATVERDGTRFRLWAPAASRVDVLLGGPDAPQEHAMTRSEAGWFERTLDAGAGARYRYRIDGDAQVPDPASRFNPDGVHEASAVVDPSRYAWRDGGWRGRRWNEAVLYELHVGTFTEQGTFAAAAEKLDYLAALGVTAVELMPVAAFAGARGWGYDGVLPFAPHAAYGAPDDMKRLVDEAHARGLMVLLDVVYNHFGPEGNYLHLYAPQFFNARHPTPWGPAINYDGERCETVRDFFVHNALYWLEEFHLDGLRVDAVHAIVDDSRPDIVDEIAARVRERFRGERDVHLVLENDRNEARRLERDARGRPTGADAQWNDDFHHALHVVVTGERESYYVDYAAHPLRSLGRALAEGFVYQGQPSRFRDGRRRGEPSAALPPAAFVDFVQNHDQVGNRALGERIHCVADPARLRMAIACMLLSPAVPLLFMGEEFAASTPFLFFCDYEPALAEAVARGRLDEFPHFAAVGGPGSDAMPDPNAQSTFEASRLDWRDAQREPGASSLAHYRRLLALRRERIVPLVGAIARGGSFDVEQEALLRVRWPLADGRSLVMLANFSGQPLALSRPPRGALLCAEPEALDDVQATLAPHAVAVVLEDVP